MGLPREKDKKLVSGQGSLSVRFSKSEWIDVNEPLVLIEIKENSISSKTTKELDSDKVPFFNIDGYVGITATSSVAELTTGVAKHEIGEKGSWTYYTYIANSDDEILVTLNVDGAGDSDLYINPGYHNYPTLEKYFRKSNEYADDEITLTKKDHQEALKLVEKLNDQKMYTSSIIPYTIGVYTFQKNTYDLLVLANSARVIKAYSGKKFKLSTSKESPLIFQIPNLTYLDNIKLVYWSDNSLIDAYVSVYSKKDDLDSQNKLQNPLLANIPTPTNYTIKDSSISMGFAKRIDIPTKVNNCDQCMFLVALYPRGASSAKVNFLPYYENSPIQLTGEETI